MRHIIIISITLCVSQSIYAESSRSSAGVKAIQLMNYGLLAELKKPKSNVAKKKMRSMIAKLSRGLPVKVSHKAKMAKKAELLISSVENETGFIE